MAYTKAVAKLTFDNAHADGLPGILGIGRDWQAREPREYGKGFSCDLEGDYGWKYEGLFEYIEPLKGIAPLGYRPLAAMDIADWTVDNGTWREWGPVGALRQKYLHYHDGNAGNYATGDYGQVTSDGNFEPNLHFLFWRYPSGYDETDPPIIEINFRGNGAVPYYALQFPAMNLTSDFFEDRFNLTGTKYDHPILAGFAPTSTFWTIIDECQHSGAPQDAQGLDTTAKAQGIRIEYVDGWLLVRMTGAEGVWAYRGPWTDDAGVEHAFELTPGKIRVAVIGHTAMFNMGQLAYPATAALDPRRARYTGPLFEQTPAYRLTKYDDPADSEITVAAVAPATYQTFPRLTFTGDGDHRAVLYNVMEHRTPTLGAAVSNPVVSQANAQVRVESLSGEMSDAWRGATCTARIRAQAGFSLPTFKGNEKLKAEVSIDDGANYVSEFTGYLTPPEKAREGGDFDVWLELQASDGIEARLQKKTMFEHCSYEGWPIKDAFEYILKRAHVPAALISVHADVSLAKMGGAYYLPVADPKGDRALKFDEDTTVPDALQEIADTRGLQWGVGYNGAYFLRPRPTYSGTPDFTLDDDTATPEDIILSFRAQKSIDDYANMIVVVVGQGSQMQMKWLMDLASIQTSTAANFIGDDWYVREKVSDGDAHTLAALAKALWEKHNTLQATIMFSLVEHPALYPDEFVKVQVSDVDVPTDSVYRITNKGWSWDTTPLYRQEFQARLVGATP